MASVALAMAMASLFFQSICVCASDVAMVMPYEVDGELRSISFTTAASPDEIATMAVTTAAEIVHMQYARLLGPAAAQEEPLQLPAAAVVATAVAAGRVEQTKVDEQIASYAALIEAALADQVEEGREAVRKTRAAEHGHGELERGREREAVRPAVELYEGVALSDASPERWETCARERPPRHCEGAFPLPHDQNCLHHHEYHHRIQHQRLRRHHLLFHAPPPPPPPPPLAVVADGTGWHGLCSRMAQLDASSASPRTVTHYAINNGQ